MIAAYSIKDSIPVSSFQLSATLRGTLGTNNNILLFEPTSSFGRDAYGRAAQRHLRNGAPLPRTVPITRVLLYPGYDAVGDVCLLKYSGAVRRTLGDRLHTGRPLPMPPPGRLEDHPRQLEDFSYSDIVRFAHITVRFAISELIEVTLLEMALRAEEPDYREIVWNMNEDEVERYLPSLQDLTWRLRRRLQDCAADYLLRLHAPRTEAQRI